MSDPRGPRCPFCRSAARRTERRWHLRDWLCRDCGRSWKRNGAHVEQTTEEGSE